MLVLYKNPIGISYNPLIRVSQRREYSFLLSTNCWLVNACLRISISNHFNCKIKEQRYYILTQLYLVKNIKDDTLI